MPNDGAPRLVTMPARRTLTLAMGDTATIQLPRVQRSTDRTLDHRVFQSAADWSDTIPLTITRPIAAVDEDELTIVSELGDVTTSACLSVAPPS